MIIYVFKSDLFIGQTRKIVSNFPLDIDLLTDMVNSDNSYPGDSRRWYLAEQY